MELVWLLLITSVLFIASIFLLRWYLAKSWKLSRGDLWLPNENVYFDPTTSTTNQFPSVLEHPSVYLSVIIPAYNERERLPVMLQEALTYLQERQQQDKAFTYELIIIDDGSKDKTYEVALNYSDTETSDKVRVLKLAKNRGKGGAVKRGMLCARGRYLLMVDADGASKFSDFDKLEKRLHQTESSGFGVAVGSRNMKDTVVKKSLLRHILTWGFHMGVEILCVKGVKDTQCGFKLFTRQSAAIIFQILHIERWAFDVELLYLAQRFGMPISEVGIVWTEIEGSKVDPVWDSLKMARDVVQIRLMYLLRIWMAHSSSSSKMV